MKEKAKRAKAEFLIPSIQGLEDKEKITLEIKGEIKEDKTSFCELISSLFSKLPAEIVDWEKEWQKHLEEKYDG
jgi:hypothetical protein